MFFDYEFHTLFTIFAFILLKVLCNAEDGPKIVSTTPTVDLKYLNKTLHCKFQPISRACATTGRTSRKYYFDVRLKRCERFEYGHCNHSYNMFDGRHQCLDECRDNAFEEIPEILAEIIYCRFQPDFGDCNSYHPSWYFDITEKTCKGFSYSGCGGNRNRFPTSMECLDVCGTAVSNTYK